MSDRPFFFGDEPKGVDAIVFATLAATMLTPIESPIRDYLSSRPACVGYVERMYSRYFPEIPGRGSPRTLASDLRAGTMYLSG
jgi:glutathione S-transferase